jgi:hypothetical protein
MQKLHAHGTEENTVGSSMNPMSAALAAAAAAGLWECYQQQQQQQR